MKYFKIGNHQINESVLEMKKEEFEKTFKDSPINTDNLWKAVQEYKRKNGIKSPKKKKDEAGD